VDFALLISSLLNIVLLILTVYFAKHDMDLSKTLALAFKKITLIYQTVNDFVKAYEDKVITKEEAEKLITDIKKIAEDP